MIEIIPKPLIKKTPWQNILLYFSIALAIVAVLGYFVLNNTLEKKTQTIQNLDETLTKLRTPEVLNLEKEVFDWAKKIKDFSILVDSHLAVSNFFSLLESLSHPKVWFFNVELKPKEAKVSFSGEAEDFSVLGQQLLIFKNEKRIQNIELSKVSLAEEKKVRFELNFSLSPEFFKF